MEYRKHSIAFTTDLAACFRLLPFVFLLTGNLAAGDPQDPAASRNAPAAAPEKGGYSLFHPTPRRLMREMSTDRPDQTESPFTLDAGHFQTELDFVNAVFDRERSGGGDLRTRDWSVVPVNFKIGLLNNVDIQFVVDTYAHSRLEDRVAGTVDSGSGLGEAQTRLKVNRWGNDGGRTAFGLLPFVKWPLPASRLRNGRTEGGLILPLAVHLAEAWELGAMTEFDFTANAAGGYDTEFVNTVTVGPQLTQKLGMYLEFVAVTGSAPGFPWRGQADVGSTYLLSEDLQLDYGCNFAVTDSAPNFNPFAGISWRF